MDLDRALLATFGSATRLKVLGALANTYSPITGYALAQVLGANPVKVYAELYRMRSAGVVAERSTSRGRRGFVIVDTDLRDLLRKRVRISSMEALFEEVELRKDRIGTALRVARSIDLAQYPPNPKSLPNLREFTRPRSKDAALTRAGARPSKRPVPRT